MFPDLDARRDLCATPVTLNGRPAHVTGAHRAFARVTDKATGLGAEWAWPTVAHVVATCGGKFTT